MKSCLIIWSILAEETYLKTLAQILDRRIVKEAENFEEKLKVLLKNLKYKNASALLPINKRA